MDSSLWRIFIERICEIINDAEKWYNFPTVKLNVFSREIKPAWNDQKQRFHLPGISLYIPLHNPDIIAFSCLPWSRSLSSFSFPLILSLLTRARACFQLSFIISHVSFIVSLHSHVYTDTNTPTHTKTLIYTHSTENLERDGWYIL